MSNKIPLVLWSGGLDSTFIVDSLLKKTQCDILHINSDSLITNAIQKERKAIEQIQQYFDSNNEYNKIRNRYFIDFNFNAVINCNMIFRQTYIWICSILQVYDPTVHSGVYMGYLINDDIAFLTKDFKKGMKHISKTLFNKKIKMKFPLLEIGYNKQHIIDYLPAELLNMVTYCENPDYKDNAFHDCGECASCIKMNYYKEKKKYITQIPNLEVENTN